MLDTVHVLVRRWVWILPAVLCAVVGYLLVWQRGFHSDDYVEARMARDAATGLWRPEFNPHYYPYFPVRTLRWLVVSNLQGLVPQQEFLIRVICAILVVVAAGLLGWLVYRMVRSRLAMVVTFWSFVVPFWAPEVIVWLAGVAYVFGIILTLFFLHACWNVVSGGSRPLIWISLGTVSLMAAISFNECFVAAPALIPFLALIAALRPEPIIARSSRLRRLVLALAVPAIAFVAAFLLVYRSSDLIVERGNTGSFYENIPSMPARVLARFEDVRHMTIARLHGGRVTLDATNIGMQTLTRSWHGVALAVGVILALAVSAITWRGENLGGRHHFMTMLAVLAFGIGWAVTAIVIPYVPIQAALNHNRLIYFSLAGVAVACGAIVWIISVAVPPRGHGLLLASSSVVLLFGTVTTLGYARAYQARFRLDSEQVRQVVQAVPVDLLPRNPIIAPIGMNERLFGRRDTISEWFIGALEGDWTAKAVLQVAYRRNDIGTFTETRWVPRRLQRQAQRVAQSDPSDPQLVELSQRTVIVVLKDGRGLPVETLRVIDADGQSHEIELLIGKRVRERGLPTEQRLEIDLRR